MKVTLDFMLLLINQYSTIGRFSGVTIKAQFLNFNVRNWAYLCLLIVQNNA